MVAKSVDNMHTHDSTCKNNVFLTDLGYSGVSGFPDTIHHS